MRLADYTDYTMRVLMYCAARPGRLVTISEIAAEHGISRNHLMKNVTDLGRQGVLQTLRGRGGGMRLLKEPSQIRVADVIRAAETDFRLVECFDASASRCTLTPSCGLKGLLQEALQAYFAVLEGRTLADLVGPPAAGAAACLVPITLHRHRDDAGAVPARVRRGRERNRNRERADA
jgi:Rrf2 family nitric oxide-sensitive transcriptional repressor